MLPTFRHFAFTGPTIRSTVKLSRNQCVLRTGNLLCNSSDRLTALKTPGERLHAEESEDLDSQRIFEEMRERFLPIQASGMFRATLR